ncbi:MAG TPA: substrate-binding domain-containing protein [Mycobacteriales bacterium]|jgi:ribose transport system substrate-binding protein|nr:substrate-binding domain-containing protein [Mycobacteriales bacterium]
MSQPAVAVAPPRTARALRRHTPLVLGLIGITAVMAACGSSSSGGNPPGAGSSSGQSPSSVHIAFVYDTTSENFAQEMSLGAGAAAKATGINLTNTAPSTANGSQQVQLFQAALQNDKNGIALATLFPDLFIHPFKQAASKNIPTIAVDAPPAAGSGVTLFIGNDNYQLGVALANALLPKIPNTAGQILIGTDTPGLPVLTARNQGFQDTLKKARPSVSFVNFNSTQEPSTNFSAWSSAVQSHPNALAYVGPGSQDAASLYEIEKKTGKHYVVGADDLDPNSLAGVAAGDVQALVSPEHWLKGYIAVDLLAEHALKGTPLPSGWWNPGYLTVDKANIQQIQQRQQSAANRTSYFQAEVNKELADPQKYIKPLSAIG